MIWGFSLVVGVCLVFFLGGLIYRIWYENGFYRKPKLARTQISLEVDDNTIYLHHIASITEEYVHSVFLMVLGFFLGFTLYMAFFFLGGFMQHNMGENILLSVTLTFGGGLFGYMVGLDKMIVIRDSGGKTHNLRLSEVDRLEFKQEINKDIWNIYK